jgi:transglutaminase-like putative cysteine protease
LQQVKAFDTGPFKKPVNEIVLRQRTGGQAIVELDIDMFAARLEPGSPEQPPRKLKGTERAALTAAERHYENDSGPFRRWMAENSLTRAKSERDADFALRVLEFIRRHFEYKIVDPKEIQDQITRLQISELAYYIKEKAAECWGLSAIYTSVLRGNGIPCRQMSGFLVEARPLRRGDHHVRAEVYLEGTGWILVEVAGAVTAKERSLLKFFGHPGNDMVLIDQGINYRLAGPREPGLKEPGHIGTFSGFAIGNANGEWSFPYATWEVNERE